MNSIKFFAFFIFMIYSIFVSSQQSENLPNKTVRAFEEKLTPEKSKTYDFNRNMIKIDFGQIMWGNVLLNYERVLMPRLGIELTGGLTMAPVLQLGFNEKKFETEKFGKYYGGMLKYYTSSYTAPEGIFVGIGTYYYERYYKDVGSFFWSSNSDRNITSQTILEFLRLSIGTSVFWDNFVLETGGFVGLQSVVNEGFIFQVRSKDPYQEKISKIGLGINLKLGVNF